MWNSERSGVENQLILFMDLYLNIQGAVRSVNENKNRLIGILINVITISSFNQTNGPFLSTALKFFSAAFFFWHQLNLLKETNGFNLNLLLEKLQVNLGIKLCFYFSLSMEKNLTISCLYTKEQIYNYWKQYYSYFQFE